MAIDIIVIPPAVRRKIADAKEGSVVFETEGPMKPLFGDEKVIWYKRVPGALDYNVEGFYMGVPLLKLAIDIRSGVVRSLA